MINNQTTKPDIFTPLARTVNSKNERFPKDYALQFNGHPRLIPIIRNQETNRVLSRFPVNIETRFSPKGQKVFEPSNKMRERLKILQQNFEKIYAPTDEGYKGEIKIPSAQPLQPVSYESFAPLDQIKKLQEELDKKEAELLTKKSREEKLNEMIKIYQKQIAELTQKTENLTKEISYSEDKLSGLRAEIPVLRQEASQKEPDFQKTKDNVAVFKNSLAQSREIVASLQEKIAIKEKLLQKTLAESSDERIRANQAISDKKAIESLVKNLRVALENATGEQQIEILTQKLKEKEEDAQKAREKAEEMSSMLEKEKQIREEIGEFKSQIGNLQKQNQGLNEELQKEESELSKLQSFVVGLTSQNQEKEKKLREQEKHLLKLRSQKEKLASFAGELSKKLDKTQSEKYLATVVEAELREKEVKKPKVKIVPAKEREISAKPLTSLVNAINGIVTTADGKLIQNAVVIIKDKSGNSLRALRTNDLGQFLIATSLSNGTYHIEIEKEGEKFDILEVELTGEVLAPIEIKAK